MTVKKLKDYLNKYPDDMQVFIEKKETEFRFAPIESAKKKKIKFIGGGKPEPKEDVVVLSDDL
jgi:hypothetical protein